MNLEILPPKVAIPVVLAAIVILPAAMWAFFRGRRWV
jgi:magnesium transporter